MSEARVLVYHAADDRAGVEEAYHRVSNRMASVPGMLGNELLRSVNDPLGFVVASRWKDLQAFLDWEKGPQHRADTAPLRAYRDTRMAVPYAVYAVSASY
jgi:heme-degrading monooxygenase HmoA